MPEVQITRNEIVNIRSIEYNDYGDLLFVDGNNVQHKVSNKRVKFFKDVLIEGRAYQLNYANAYNKEYIYNAVPVGDNLPPPQPNVTVTLPENIQKEIQEANKLPINPTQRSICLSYAVWLAQYGMVPVGSIGSVSLQLERYCAGQLEADQLDANITKLIK